MFLQQNINAPMVDVSLLHGIGNKPSTGGASYFIDMIRTKFSEKARFCYYYLITNQITGKQYVGRILYKGDPNNDIKYMGSSKYLKLDFEIYGIENFTKIILTNSHFIDRKMLDEKESYFVHKYNTLHPNGYNRYDPGKKLGFNHAGIPLSEEHKSKIGNASKNHKHSDETKQKMSLAQKGIPKTKEHKEKLRQVNLGNKNSLGRVNSEETRLKISTANKGRKATQETKDKMSISHLGNKSWTDKHPSEKTKRKIKETFLRKGSPWLGKHHSEETKQKLSASHLGKTTWNKGLHLSQETKDKISLANINFRKTHQ